MKKITLEEFTFENPRTGYYSSAAWRATASELMQLQVDECVELNAADFGLEEGTYDWDEYPSISDAARVRSLVYSRGMAVSIYRDAENKVMRVRCVSR